MDALEGLFEFSSFFPLSPSRLLRVMPDAFLTCRLFSHHYSTVCDIFCYRLPFSYFIISFSDQVNEIAFCGRNN